MRKKIINIIFISVFLVLCLIPFIGMLVFGGSTALANEIQSARPVLINEDGSFNSGFLDEVSSYIGDRFYLRPQLITAWAKLNAGLLNTSTEDQVILGKNGWLYYASSTDDYMGKGLSDEELEQCAQNLAAIQSMLNAKGTRFVFTIAPNKNSLYPQNMPDSIPNGHESSNAARLIPYLDKYHVHYVDLFSTLGEDVLYYSTDSHWTAEGAAKAADLLLSSVDRSSSYSEGSFGIDGIHKGDLYDMLYPSAKGTEGQVVYSDGFRFECLNDPNGGNAITIETGNLAAKGKLFCWRDSFGIDLYPFLADSFQTAVFSRNENYDLSLLGSEKYDVVMIELVERNIANLLEIDTAAAENNAKEGTSEPQNTENTADRLQTAKSFDGESVDALIAVIGEPLSRNYASSCMGSGEDGELAYDGFTVFTYKDGDSEKIVDVEASEKEDRTPFTASYEYDVENAVFITDDLFFVGPELHCIDENGGEVMDASAHGLSFDSTGAETTGNEELDAYVRQIIADNVDPESMSQIEMLQALYQYCVDNFDYRRRNYYDFGEEGWVEDEALTMFSTQKGNCYDYAAAFCELARGIGYDAKAYSGTVGPDRKPHAWVEIEIDGETKLFDPEDDWTIAIHGELKKFNITLEEAERYKYIHA